MVEISHILHSPMVLAAGIITVVIYTAGVIAALDALLWAKNAQTAIAWSLSLVSFPYLVLPFYLVFGRRRFRGYAELKRKFIQSNQIAYQLYRSIVSEFSVIPHDGKDVFHKTLEKTANSRYLEGNRVRLITTGVDKFESLTRSIQKAQHYVFLSYYIVRDDEIGLKIKEELIKKSKEGVKILFIYDEVGSSELSNKFLYEMETAGIKVVPFRSGKGIWKFVQINFRNHRKIVVIDGQEAYIGGFNIGDEYLSRSTLGYWNDSHICIDGPAVTPIQTTFLYDWHWATQSEELVEVKKPHIAGDADVLTIATGPADSAERSILFFLSLINGAKERLWLATPYFLPDDSLLQALKLAAFRGVDVRVVLPDKPDVYLPWFASFYYAPELRRAGVKIFRYTNGFLHKKVMLIDNSISVIGSSNFDNRSFRLNFEINAVISNETFAKEVESMFEQDISHCHEELLEHMDRYAWYKQLAANFARLFNSVL